MKSKPIAIPLVIELDSFGNKTIWFNNLPLYQHDYNGNFTPGNWVTMF